VAGISKAPFRQLQLKVGQTSDCQFSTVQAAIDFAATLAESCEIFIDEGIYEETIKVYQSHLTLIGIGNVVITAGLAALQKDEQGNALGTFKTATMFINGEDIFLKNIQVINHAGSGDQVGQAVAVYFEGTGLTATSCVFDAYQDTLCLGPLPAKTKEGMVLKSSWVHQTYPTQESHFYDCQVTGTVDFIFGGGNAVFEQCRIHCKNSPQTNYISAASTPKEQKGLRFIKCQISGEKEYYLGRPWRQYAKTTYNDCQFDKYLVAEGWSPWNQSDLSSVTYSEEDCSYAKLPVRESWITIKGAMYREKN
jgi:pectinesterase